MASIMAFLVCLERLTSVQALNRMFCKQSLKFAPPLPTECFCDQLSQDRKLKTKSNEKHSAKRMQNFALADQCNIRFPPLSMVEPTKILVNGHMSTRVHRNLLFEEGFILFSQKFSLLPSIWTCTENATLRILRVSGVKWTWNQTSTV